MKCRSKTSREWGDHATVEPLSWKHQQLAHPQMFEAPTAHLALMAVAVFFLQATRCGRCEKQSVSRCEHIRRYLRMLAVPEHDLLIGTSTANLEQKAVLQQSPLAFCNLHSAAPDKPLDLERNQHLHQSSSSPSSCSRSNPPIPKHPNPPRHILYQRPRPLPRFRPPLGRQTVTGLLPASAAH